MITELPPTDDVRVSNNKMWKESDPLFCEWVIDTITTTTQKKLLIGTSVPNKLIQNHSSLVHGVTV